MLKALVVAQSHLLAIRFDLVDGFDHDHIDERVKLALRDIRAALAKARGEADA